MRMYNVHVIYAYVYIPAVCWGCREPVDLPTTGKLYIYILLGYTKKPNKMYLLRKLNKTLQILFLQPEPSFYCHKSN